MLNGERQPQTVRLNDSLLFQGEASGIDRNNVQLRFEIQTQLTPGKNTLEIILPTGGQPADEPCSQAGSSPLRVIPLEVYLEIQENDAAE